MPLSGSVANRIRELHHAQHQGRASRQRSNRQIVAIAFASKRRRKRR
jgi:hypothetical protein